MSDSNRKFKNRNKNSLNEETKKSKKLEEENKKMLKDKKLIRIKLNKPSFKTN